MKLYLTIKSNNKKSERISSVQRDTKTMSKVSKEPIRAKLREKYTTYVEQYEHGCLPQDVFYDLKKRRICESSKLELMRMP